MYLVSVSVSQPDVEFKTEPCFAFEFILWVTVIKCVVVFGIEAPCITGVLKEYRQLQFTLHSGWPVNKISQVQPLIDATVPE